MLARKGSGLKGNSGKEQEISQAATPGLLLPVLWLFLLDQQEQFQVKISLPICTELFMIKVVVLLVGLASLRVPMCTVGTQ